MMLGCEALIRKISPIHIYCFQRSARSPQKLNLIHSPLAFNNPLPFFHSTFFVVGTEVNIQLQLSPEGIVHKKCNAWPEKQSKTKQEKIMKQCSHL